MESLRKTARVLSCAAQVHPDLGFLRTGIFLLLLPFAARRCSGRRMRPSKEARKCPSRDMADRKMSLNELSARVGVANVNRSKRKTGKVSVIRSSTSEAVCAALHCQPGDIPEYQPSEPLAKETAAW